MEGSNRRRKRREVLAFFIATFLVTWLCWLPPLLAGGDTPPAAGELLLRLGTFAPSVMGLAFAYRAGGKGELKALLTSLIRPRIKAGWWLFILLTLPGAAAVSVLLTVLLGGGPPEPAFPYGFIPIAFLYILILLGPLGEEAGWRGYALPLLLERMRPLCAALLLGGVWSLWHLPLFFIEGTTQNALMGYGAAPALLCYLLYTVMISVLMTLLFVGSGGSVLGAVLFHTMGNLSLGVAPLVFEKKSAAVFLAVLGLVCAGFVAAFRKTMLARGTQ